MPRPFKPEQFGRYLLAEKIATGGMAEIFNAKVFGAMGFEKSLVIKRILPQFGEDSEFLRMFITEAKLVCHLEHPNIVQVHDFGEIDGQYYIAMEFVNGIDARHLWRTLAKRKQRLPGLLALFIVSEFLKGLDYAHRAVGPEGQLLGVVHRDVSPSNILISYRGDVKIGDFGIALVQQESKTQAGVLKGKFGYMSPEQVAGMKVDHRSDIFAAGIVLIELLLGRRLFLGQSDFETLDKVLNVRLDVLDEHESALPPDVVKIVRKAVRREVGERYQSAQEFCDAIVEFLYDRRARITSETLAAFIAEHVAPYLVRGSGRGEISASIASRSGGSPGVAVLKSGIMPVVDVGSGQVQAPPESAAPASWPSSQREDESDQDLALPAPSRPASRRGPSTASAPARPRDGSAPAGHGSASGSALRWDPAAGRQASSSPRPPEPPLTSPPSAAQDALLGRLDSAPHVVPAAEPTEMQETTDTSPPFADSAQDALSVIDSADMAAFGAIPVFEMDSGEAALDLERPLEAEEPIQAQVEGAGEEFDLGDGEEEEIYVPPVVREEADVGVLVSGRLRSAASNVMVQEPDYAGKLSSRTVAKVLFRFSVVDETGLLVLTGPEALGEQAELLGWLRSVQQRAQAQTDGRGKLGRTCTIHLQRGDPHLVSADRSEEALVAYLIRDEVLEASKVEQAILQNPHRKPVSALIASGMLAPLQVSRRVTAFVLATVLEAFGWTDGEFAFYREREAPSEAFPTGLDTVGMIKRGVASIDELTLDRTINQMSGRRVFLNRTPPARIERFAPDTLLEEAYSALSGGRTVENLLEHLQQHGTGVEARQALYLLLECELAALG